MRTSLFLFWSEYKRLCIKMKIADLVIFISALSVFFMMLFALIGMVIADQTDSLMDNNYIMGVFGFCFSLAVLTIFCKLFYGKRIKNK